VLSCLGGFIVGFDNDTPSIFQRQIDFIQQSGIVTAMVGLLQAPFGTQLYARMQSEGRLLDVISGDNADGTTNIIPKMDVEVLKSGYLGLVQQIYSPNMFYQRVKTLMKEHHPRQATVNIHPEEIMAFFRSIWLLGILGKERWQYWNLFFWTLFHFPSKFPQAITFSIYGYHFRILSELHTQEYNTARETKKIPAGKKQWISGPIS